MKDPRELIIHDLQDVYSAEHIFLKAMQTMHQEASNQQLKQSLERHIQTSKQQASDLESCFQALSEKPKQIGCPGAEGIVREFQEGMREIKSPELMDLFILSAAMKGEHYEIASYTGLSQGLRMLGEQKCMQTVESILSQEKSYAQSLEQMKSQMGQKMASGQMS